MVPLTAKPRKMHLPERQIAPLISKIPDNPALLPGDPGYRIQSDHSALDLLESNAEIARMVGVFLRDVFYGQMRIRNQIAKLILAAIGVSVLIPLLLAFLALGGGQIIGWMAWILCILLTFLGVMMLDELIENK